MKAFVRDIFDLAIIYVVGVVVTVGWILLGVYIYSRPAPINSIFGAEINQDIGTSLIAQGLIFFLIFTIGGAIRVARGKRDEEEAAKDRQMLREMYQWMQEQRQADMASKLSVLPSLSGNGAKPEGKIAKLR